MNSTILLLVLVAIVAGNECEHGRHGRHGHQGNPGQHGHNGHPGHRGNTTYPPCNDLKAQHIDFKNAIRLSPLYIYQTTEDIFNCTKLAYVGPAQDATTHVTGSAILLRGSYAFTFDINVVDGNSFDTVYCPDGTTPLFKLIRSQFNTKDDTSICVAKCAPNGIDYDAIICAGRGRSDYNKIQKFLDKTLPGFPGIFNAQTNCTGPTTCSFFNN